MHRPAALSCVATLLAGPVGVAGIVLGQSSPLPRGSHDHPAIAYSTRETNDAVASLNRRLRSGQQPLVYDGPGGYLRSILAALDVPLSSQTLVYSPTSLQAENITKDKPRAIYFNDSVAVGWVNGTEHLEVAVHDPAQGVVFYTLEQTRQPRPELVRTTRCLECHLGSPTLDVPGFVVMSVLPLSDNKFEYAQGWAVDHRTPIEDRWGGWYVTGAQVPSRHLGNVPVSHVERSYVRAAVAPKLPSMVDAIDTTPYLAPHSDVVAQLVLNHQAHAANLVTRLGWEARIAEHGGPSASNRETAARVHDAARELVDYFLFVDEAPLPSPVRGASAFAREFSARGPRDREGRSLRDLDLDSRLFRYRCSYMIYTEAFEALPPAAKAAVYERLWRVLSGKESDPAYARLPRVERKAIIEILRSTKPSLPSYFQPLTAP